MRRLIVCLVSALPLLCSSTLRAENAETPFTAEGVRGPSFIDSTTAGFSDPKFDAFSPSSIEQVSATSTSAPELDSDGVRLDALEKKFNDFLTSSKTTTYPTVKINGVFQADFGWISQDDDSLARYGRIKNGADFRRARLSASGALTEVNNYFLQMDFAFFGKPTFTDLWVEQTDLPVLGNFRVGQWKQPFSLEVVSSFRYTTFVERSVLFQPFTPFRHLGAGFYDRNDDLTATWAASAFAAGQDQYGGSIATAGGIGTAERFTLLPYYDEQSDGRYYLHMGAGHYFSAPNDHAVNFRTIPEMYVGQYNSAADPNPGQQPVPTTIRGVPFFVATGTLPVDHYNVLGSELLWVNGPWSLQSEGMANFVNRLNASNVFFYGAYAQVGYFLTGEHRPYDRKAGAIDRIKPFENFFRVRGEDRGICRGSGAWELAARLSYLHLNDQDVRGGTLTDVTGGLNWYLNPYTKCQLNYIHAFSTNATSVLANTDLFDIRVQMDF
ncbi:MAG: porin [Planctomycetaceae bacterium]|nr:porin [Planctomycetaceae bacterium]